jgi:hypothetical protein
VCVCAIKEAAFKKAHAINKTQIALPP